MNLNLFQILNVDIDKKNEDYAIARNLRHFRTFRAATLPARFPLPVYED